MTTTPPLLTLDGLRLVVVTGEALPHLPAPAERAALRAAVGVPQYAVALALGVGLAGFRRAEHGLRPNSPLLTHEGSIGYRRLLFRFEQMVQAGHTVENRKRDAHAA